MWSQLTAITARASFGRAVTFILELTSGPQSKLRAASEEANHRQPDQALTLWFAVLGIYLIAFGLAVNLADFAATKAAAALWPDLLPAFKPFRPTYNRTLLAAVALVGFTFGAFFLRSVWPMLMLRRDRIHFNSGVCAALAAVGIVTAHTVLAQISFGAALAVIVFYWPVHPRLLTRRPPQTGSLVLPSWANPILLAGCVVIVGLGATNFYPVQLPNDYYELADQTAVADVGARSPTLAGWSAKLSELELMRCVATRKIDSPDPTPISGLTAGIVVPTALSNSVCPLPEAAAADAWRTTLAANGGWQTQAGRLFYHHSYMFVPAIHLLKYGFDRSVPYLYGHGNTLFHAAMMALMKPSLTSYFETYPIAVLIGLCAIGLLVTYVTRNIAAGISAFALAAFAFLSIDPVHTRLAPGFSPLRFFGLLAQFASIIFFLRGAARRRVLFLPAALAFSIFWNTEFAILGFASQVVAIASPRVELRRAERAIVGAGCLAIVLLGYLILGPWNGLSFTQVAFFGISVPRIATGSGLMVIVLNVAVSIFVIRAAGYFRGIERLTRIAMLPAVALMQMKYLYNPSEPHFWFSLVFIAPAILTFAPWPAGTKATPAGWGAGIVPALFPVVAVLIAVVQGTIFAIGARGFDRTFLDPFATERWTALNEQFATAVPAAPIVDRVTAARAVLRDGDTVLLLSPFDHLIAYYTNPKAFCGHFELLTNLVTEEAIQQTVRCALESKELLVVYDDYVEMGCPDGDLGSILDKPACRGKYLLKLSERRVLDTLRPHLNYVGNNAHLQFYRLKAAT